MLLNAFVIPIFRYSLEDWQDKKKVILGALPNPEDCYVDDSKEEQFEFDTNHYSDYYINKDEAPEYAEAVIPCIADEVEKFCIDTKSNWNMTNMWFQSYDKGHNFSIHNHGPVGWSAILYVEFNPEVHQATTFYSPFQSHDRHDCGSFKTWIPDACEGDLFIFPANLQHESGVNLGDERRTILSFNLQ